MEQSTEAPKTSEQSTMNKRGQMGGGMNIQTWILGFFLVIILGAVYALVLTVFGDVDNSSEYQQIITDGLGLFTGFFAQLPTIGKIAGVLLLVGLVGGAGYGGYSAYQSAQKRR